MTDPVIATLGDRHWALAARGVLLAIGSAGLLHLIFAIDVVAHLPHTSICLFQAFAGTPCPGCGLTRALLLLGQLEGTRALALHPFAPAVLVAVVWIAAEAPRAKRILRRPVPHCALIAVLAFWSFRLFAPSS